MRSLRLGVWLIVLCGLISPGTVPGAPVLSPSAIGAWRTSYIGFSPLKAGGATNVILSLTAAMGMGEGEYIAVSLGGGFAMGNATRCISTSSVPPNVFGMATWDGSELVLPIIRPVAEGTLVRVVVLSRPSGTILLPAQGLPANFSGLTMRTNAVLGPVPHTSIRESPAFGVFTSAALQYMASGARTLLASVSLTPSIAIGLPGTARVNGTMVMILPTPLLPCRGKPKRVSFMGVPLRRGGKKGGGGQGRQRPGRQENFLLC